MDIKRITGMLALAGFMAAGAAAGNPAKLYFSRDELLAGEAIGASPRKGLERRIEQVFTQVLQQALRLHPAAEHWDWQLVLVNRPVPPFALPDGQIFMSAKWVASRRLADPEMRVSDVLRMVDEEWHLTRELEPLMQAQEFEADHMGLRIVCSAGIARSEALTLFDKMARADRRQEPEYIKSHPGLLARKQSLLGSIHARSLGCED